MRLAQVNTVFDIRFQAHRHMRPATTVVVRTLETVGVGLPPLFADAQHGAVLELLELEDHQDFIRLVFRFVPLPGVEGQFDQFVFDHLPYSDRVFTLVVPTPGNGFTFDQVAARAVYEIFLHSFAGYDRIEYVCDGSIDFGLYGVIPGHFSTSKPELFKSLTNTL